jgi:hypothetical protein
MAKADEMSGELLLIVKPNLAQAASKDINNIVQTLHDIAKLAETFTTRKASELVAAAAFVDQLDTEGVYSSFRCSSTRNDASKVLAFGILPPI